MRGENGLGLNLPEVRDAVARADVLVVGFVHLTPRVLFDLRPGPSHPLFRLVAPVRTPDERFAQLRRLRPGVPDPERFVFIQWPLGLDSLVETSVWETIVARCQVVAGEQALSDCDGIMQRLRILDSKELREAIGGDSYRSLWPKRTD